MQKREEIAAANTVSDDIDDIRNKLLVIRIKAADYDRKGILDSIAEIKSCSAKTMAVFDTIKELVMHSHFNEAESVASSYMYDLSYGEKL